jgi:hypothetical protein
MIINRIYENQNLLSLQFVSFLVGLRTYQQPCKSPTFTLAIYPSSSFGLLHQITPVLFCLSMVDPNYSEFL